MHWDQRKVTRGFDQRKGTRGFGFPRLEAAGVRIEGYCIDCIEVWHGSCRDLTHSALIKRFSYCAGYASRPRARASLSASRGRGGGGGEIHLYSMIRTTGISRGTEKGHSVQDIATSRSVSLHACRSGQRLDHAEVRPVTWLGRHWVNSRLGAQNLH